MNKVNLENQLANNPLTYRSILTIPPSVNFGLELELDEVNYDEVKRLVNDNFPSSWQVKEDKSLTANANAEIVSPILRNKKDTWKLLEKMGKLLNRLNPNYNKCSFQVNFDANNLTIKDKIRFLKLFAAYEDIIYRFSKGEDESYRDSLETYSYPIILSLKSAHQLDDEYALEMFSNNKRYGVIFKTNNKNLVEIRTPNATSNPILWQNYITTFYYLLSYATSKRCNEKELDEYIDSFMKLYLLEYYEHYHEERAIDFSEKIFKHKTDKLYFLHQYRGPRNNI